MKSKLLLFTFLFTIPSFGSGNIFSLDPENEYRKLLTSPDFLNQKEILSQKSCFVRTFFKIPQGASEDEEDRVLLKYHRFQKAKINARFFSFPIVVGAIGGALMYGAYQIIPDVGDFGGAFVLYPLMPPATLLGVSVWRMMLGSQDHSLDEIEKQVVVKFRHWNLTIQKNAKITLISALKSTQAPSLEIKKLEYMLSLPLQKKTNMKELPFGFDSGMGEETDKELKYFYKLLKSNQDELIHSLLLIGKPGIGKTTLSRTFSETLGLTLVTPDLTGTLFGSGENPGTLLKAFRKKETSSPFILLLDDLDTALEANNHLMTEILRLLNKKEVRFPFLDDSEFEMPKFMVWINANQTIKKEAFKNRCITISPKINIEGHDNWRDCILEKGYLWKNK